MAMNLVESRDKRKKRVRFKLRKHNNSQRVRLSVFRSNNHFYAQIIDDFNGCTLAAASTNEPEFRKLNTKTNDIAAAKKVADILSARAKKASIGKAIFDKGAYAYHGKVAAFAAVCREQEILD